ncbi:MAG TPA: bifunctional acetate--CoA ligase family protein/GNAT family N-acetyltransferase [Candidatus Bathyarchaeia archaeon]
MGIENLNRVLNPSRIAVIGASEREGSIGAKILRNLTASGFAGEVYPVNPFRQTVQGMQSYSSIGKIPGKIDLAVIATQAHLVPQIVEECGVAGVCGIIIISAGFRGTGETSSDLERRIREHQKKYSLRIVGPNSLGIIRPKTKLFATFAERGAMPGRIAFISQSAALCAYALDWGWDAHVGFSAVVSTGSMIDVDVGDFVDYFGTDPQTKTIMIYVESLKNPRKFMSAVRQIAREKPIVLVKAGRFRETREATLSHSGSLAGEDAIYDAAFKRAGIVRVEKIGDLFNSAVALSRQPSPEGLNLTIVTNAGGPAIMATDHLVAKGGRLTQLTAETIQAIKQFLPPYCSLKNPVDIYEEATVERFRNVLDVCLKDKNSHGFLVVYTPQGGTDPITLAEVITELVKNTGKPILAAIMGADDCCREARRILQRNGVPSFVTPEEAVSTFVHMYGYTRNLDLLYQTPQNVTVTQINVPLLKSIIRKAFCEGRTVLSLSESLSFLEEYRIPAVKTVVARNPEEAETMSTELGYPVVMKILSPQVTHKSRIEGVVLNICSPSEASAFFAELSGKVKASISSEFQGVALQPMVRERRHELLLGAKKDPQFGSVILFGMGGTSAESFRDVSVGFPPLNQVLARRLIEDTDVFKHSLSSKYPLNVNLLDEILVKFSQLVTDFQEIREVDINPLIATEKNVVAVDARIVIEYDRIMREVADHHDHTLIASYPKEYTALRRLKGGAEVVLRPIKAEDESNFNELIKSLSVESMRFRFFEQIKEMSHETLTKYCNLDYDRQIAIVAELSQEGKKIVGAGRVIAEPDGKSGEFAVVVTDEWQSKGLGSILMDYIINVAKNMRLESIFATVLSDNIKMMRLCEKKGFKMETLDEETVKALLSLS